MNDNLVSIIVPNYNNSKYLMQCIDSILNQTHENIEIIIIDDASTDDSVEVINNYIMSHSAIKLIENDKNQGVTRNRHTAILKSQGNYITTLDSDDFFIDKKKIENEFSILKLKGKDSIAFSNTVLVDKDGNEMFPNAKNNIKEGMIFEDIIARTCMIPRDFLFTKEQYFAVGGFDSKIPIYEDWDLKIRLSRKYDFFYSGLDGIAYRRHGEGLSSASQDSHLKWLKYIYKKNKGLIEKEKETEVNQKFDHFLNKAFSYKKSKSFLKKVINKIKGVLKWVK